MAQAQTPASDTRRTIEVIILIALVSAFLVVSLLVHKPFESGNLTKEMVGTVIAAAVTLIMYSFLYRDNPLFKIAENLYVGVALGYGAIITWREALLPDVFEPLFLAPTRDAFWSALAARGIPVILGLLLLTRLSRKHSWLSRYSYGPLVGWGAGMAIVLTFHTNILKQLQAAIAPLQAGITRSPVGENLAFGEWLGQWLTQVGLPVLGALVLLVGTAAVLFYFFFSVEHKRLGKATANVGIWFLMISFGATFGYTVMGRLSLLIDRVDFLLFEWLRIPR